MLQKQIESLNDSNKKLRDQLNDKDNEISNLKREREGLLSKIRDLQYSNEDNERNWRNSERAVGDLQNDLEKHRRELRDFSETKERLSKTEREKDSLNHGIKTANDMLNQVRKSNDELNRINRQQEQEISERYRR